LKARIRDFIETKNGWIFSVADYAYSEGFRCLLRYVPNPAGSRESGGKKYKKMEFDESFEFLLREKPKYVHDLHVVPEKDVARIYRPHKELPVVAKKDNRVNRISTLLAQGGIPGKCMGITGSMLVGLQSPSSDIDFVVYGSYWWKAREIVTKAKAEGLIQELDESMWRRIYSKRKPEIGFEEFVLHEQRKGNRGMIDGTYFDLLFTRDWSQIGPNLPGKVVGRHKIVGKVVDAQFSFDSPAIFKVEHEISEIFCYSHTYAGQALPGEIVEAVGVLEETPAGQRLVVGTTREAKGEWIRSLTLLDGKAKKATTSI
jgi:predicted nucleotidyltransferase